MFEPLPALIRLQRAAKGLTIDGLASLAGVSRTRIITLEKGDDNITLEVLVKIANALEMTELRIGGLRLIGATPDFNAAAAAEEVLEAGRNMFDQVTDMRAELDRLSEALRPALGSVIAPRERPAAAPPRESVPAKRGPRRRAG